MSTKHYLKPPYTVEWPSTDAAAQSNVLSAIEQLIEGSNLVRKECQREPGTWTPRQKPGHGSGSGNLESDLGLGRKRERSATKKSCEPDAKRAKRDLASDDVSNVTDNNVAAETPNEPNTENTTKNTCGKSAKIADTKLSDKKSKFMMNENIFIGLNTVMRRIESQSDVSVVLLDTNFLKISPASRYLALLSEETNVRMYKVDGLQDRLSKSMNLNRVSVLGVRNCSEMDFIISTVSTSLRPVVVTRRTAETSKTIKKSEESSKSQIGDRDDSQSDSLKPDSGTSNIPRTPIDEVVVSQKSVEPDESAKSRSEPETSSKKTVPVKIELGTGEGSNLDLARGGKSNTPKKKRKRKRPIADFCPPQVLAVKLSKKKKKLK